jgi:hypothetical protein
MPNKKNYDEKIAAVKAEIAQKEARVKELLQQQKKQERAERTHRLCLRGGKLEKLLPELARLTEEQFETFVEKCLLTPHTKRMLSELAPPESEQADDENDAKQNDGSGTVKPEITMTESTSAVARTDATPAKESVQTLVRTEATTIKELTPTATRIETIPAKVTAPAATRTEAAPTTKPAGVSQNPSANNNNRSAQTAVQRNSNTGNCPAGVSTVAG